MKKLPHVILFIVLAILSGCNSDDPKFSSSQIQNALFEMKGTYHGKMNVSYYQGDRVSEGNECKFVSKDSMTVYMDLAPMALTVADEEIASRLREIGIVQVKAGYEFYQMDETMYHFVLRPVDVDCPGGYGAPESVRIVFAQNYGGDAEYFYHNMMFNLSPVELWVGNKKYEPFRKLVYHYEGTMQ